MPSKTKIQTKIVPIKVDPDNPFAQDALNREGLCKEWSKFIEKSTTPYTLAIDAQWGDGKTTLLNMLKAHMTKQGFVCVSYDAWECDFYGDALPTLIGEIQRQIKEIKAYQEPVKEQLEKRARKLLKLAVSSEVILPAIVKVISGGVAADKISDMVNEVLEEHDEIQRYLDYKKAVDEFKGGLKSLAQKIKEKTEKPLVIFVDELDRCRPIFAVEVLEKVKHLFDVESIFFVFAINKNESVKTIQTIYGNINGDAYLRKFFDRTIPLVNTGNLITHSDVDSIFSFMSMNAYLPSERVYPGPFLDLFVQDYRVSLRDQEQIRSIVKVAMCKTEISFFPHSILLTYFVTLKFANLKLYIKSKIAMRNRDISQLPFTEYDNFHKEKVGMSIKERTDQILKMNGRPVHRHACATFCALGYIIDKEYQTHIEKCIKNAQHRGDLAFYEHVKRGAIDLKSHMFNDNTTIIDEIDRIGDFVDSIDNPQ